VEATVVSEPAESHGSPLHEANGAIAGLDPVAHIREADLLDLPFPW